MIVTASLAPRSVRIWTPWGIKEVLSAPRSPWQRAYVERVIGSIRRECLDHVLILNEASLRRTIKSYLVYYHGSRTHLSLAKDTPSDGRFNRRHSVTWSPSPTLPDSTTGTNAARPEDIPIVERFLPRRV
jgi:transposase InsO family protein